VTLGTVDGERVAVASGVAAGDVVVTEGGDRLRDGAPVLLPSAAPVPAATAAPGGPAADAKRPPSAHRRPRTNNAQ
jgi:multidrug efflux system membrane fusion protein